LRDDLTTKVVNRRTASYDIYIGRPSAWGNPFVIGKDGNRDEVIRKYKEYVQTIPDFKRVIKEQLRGKTLGCWCKPNACHGDVLAEIADSE
jgi:hypothetical protein